MSVKKIKTGLRAWLLLRARIDAWDLDAPKNLPTVLGGQRYPSNIGIELPVEDLRLRRSREEVEASGRFSFLLVFRFSGKAAKEQLPMGSCEALQNWLTQEAVRSPQAIWEGIRSLEAYADSPVSLARVAGEDSDWLIVLRLDFLADFYSRATPDEFGGLQPGLPQIDPTELKQIAIAVNRALHPVTPALPETYTQDAYFILGDSP